MNIYGQPGCNTVQIFDDLEGELQQLRRDLPPDMKLAFFYDQSQFVREGVRSVWEAIFLGLGLSVVARIVSAHGGRVLAEDAPGGGACFRIQWPQLDKHFHQTERLSEIDDSEKVKSPTREAEYV